MNAPHDFRTMTADTIGKDLEVLDVAADLISAVPEDQQDELREIYARRREELSQAMN